MSDEKNNPVEAPDAQGPLLPEPLAGYVAKAKTFWSRLPIPAKIFAGAMVATIAAVSLYFSVAPMMQDREVLFTQLDREDAAAIVERLKGQNVPFTLTGDGTTIEVPSDKVHELRLALAAEGLPQGGQVGFESFENMRLGATEFEQHVTYRRAMEGELARTITTVRAVKNARVHLVMPRKSVFAQKREPASASVVVSLQGRLDEAEVHGIIHLVATAVPDLEPERIALVTTDGRMLHRPRNGDEGVGSVDPDQLAATSKLEGALEERTRSMLERILGPGHVDVRIRAEVDTAKVETKSDRYNPEQTALRSEQAMEERLGGVIDDGDTVAGVPGAESNLPGDQAIVGEAANEQPGGTLRKSHTRNFEVDRVQEHRVSVSQKVERLAVAVVVDGMTQTVDGVTETVPRSDEELAKLTALVKSAVGFDEARGDVVTVQSVPFFNEELPVEEEVPPVLPAKYQKQVDRFMPIIKVAVPAFFGLIAFLLFRRSLKRRRKEAEKRRKALEAAQRRDALAAAIQPKALGEGESEDGTEHVDFKVEALQRAQSDPATAALVVRHWLGTSADETKAA